MSEQPEALRLAEKFEDLFGPSPTTKELRRLHEMNKELIKALEMAIPYVFKETNSKAKADYWTVRDTLKKARGEQ